ncbi:hypothetical protein IMSAGC008_01448 [Muribaculaceae bacterium]|jgi:hypothetical protein|nr:hypothetical protein IMSAGC008_01448 [Muribaculaceae bacterium]
MKYYSLAIAFAVIPAMVSCIQDEPLNAECDIVSVTLAGDVLNREPRIDNDKVILIVKKDVSVMALSPEFELTPGATIEPPSGTTLNFLLPQKYVVTSESGEWSKTYTVEVQRNNNINLDYGFEKVRVVGALGGMCHYDEFYEVGTAGNETMVWASANSAYALTMQASTPETFPTYQGSEGIAGKCVVLTTRGTGDFGKRMGKPIAAGNLFIGKFDGTNAIKHPLEATHFGAPFTSVPTYFSGYYRYTPGKDYCRLDEEGDFVPVLGKTDCFNLYAVLFEAVPGMEWLDGTNVLSEDNPNIIATAEIPDRKAEADWRQFSVPFKYRAGKSIDYDKLKAGRYSLSVVMSSSQDGDYFAGAIGSTLMVDELSITCESEK